MVMRLSLIGMAGSGKSYWSVKLAELGFYRFCCDDLIEERLAPELRRADGTSMGLAEWMGFPYEPDYQSRESKYLTYEIDVLNGILKDLGNRQPNHMEKIVIDTTGSVIYTGQEILEKLLRFTTVVHLSTPPEVKERHDRQDDEPQEHDRRSDHVVVGYGNEPTQYHVDEDHYQGEEEAGPEIDVEGGRKRFCATKKLGRDVSGNEHHDDQRTGDAQHMGAIVVA